MTKCSKNSTQLSALSSQPSAVPAHSSTDVLIRAEDVSKKFCRSLKRALWYGVQDIGAQFLRSNGTRELRKNEFWAVKDVSFELKRGECLGLVGRNGAGKSTLLKMLNGLIMPDAGRITMRGRVGALIELGAGMNPILTGRENIYNKGAMLGFTKREMDAKFDAIVDYSELEEFIDTPFQHYSSGMKVRLGFAVSAHLEPDIMLIDEVLAVGDRGFKAKCLDTISTILQNSAVIFVSHSMPMVSRICTDILLMERGQTEFKGNDVGKGIDLYHEKFGGMKTAIFSNGTIDIENVVLQNGSKRQDWNETDTFQFNSGDDFSVEITLRLNENVEILDLTLVFWNQNLVPVADCKSQLAGERIPGAKGLLTIQSRIPRFYLNGGLHSMDITIENAQTRERYAKAANAVSFYCRSRALSNTGFMLPGEWQWESENS